MTDGEFKLWLDEHLSVFPSIRSWLTDLKAGSQPVLQSWRKALRKVALEDAQRATRAMISGEEQAPEAYEKELTAAKVAAVASQYASQRADDRRSEELRGQLRVQAVPPGQMGGLFQRALELIESGKSPAEAARQLVPVDAQGGPRFKCWRCQDSGLVDVWHPSSVHAVLRGTFDRSTARSCVTLCDCDAGHERISPPDARKRFWTGDHVFSEDCHCLCRNGDTGSERNIAELRGWCEGFEERRVRRMANYSPEFADWNERSGPS